MSTTVRTAAIAGLAGAVVGAGALAAPGIGRDRERITAHSAAAGHSAPVARAANHERRTTGPDYREYRGTIAPGEEDGATLTCPRSAPYAVGGYFGSISKAGRGKIVMTNSNPVGTQGRRWDIGIFSAAPERIRYYVGVTCMRRDRR